MFNGIILKSMQIQTIFFEDNFCRFTIKKDSIFDDSKIGDSVAIDGACHTIESFDNNLVQFFSSAETISKTIIQNYELRSFVNIELPMLMSSKIDGHFVTGHIDCIGKIVSINFDKNGGKIKIEINEKFLELLIYKGSIAINGTSLTINNIDNNIIELYVIPVTLEKTNLNLLKVDSFVNIEFDMFGKYVINVIKKYGKN